MTKRYNELHNKLINHFTPKLHELGLEHLLENSIDDISQAIVEFWLPQKVDTFEEALTVLNQVVPEVDINDILQVEEQKLLFSIIHDWTELLK